MATEDQERELVAIVERLTVQMQQMAERLWPDLGTRLADEIREEAGALNMRLCEAFPYLRDSPGDAQDGATHGD